MPPDNDLKQLTIEFAWDVLAYAGCYIADDGVYDDCANSAAELAASWLESQGLLEHVGGRLWREKK